MKTGNFILGQATDASKVSIMVLPIFFSQAGKTEGTAIGDPNLKMQTGVI